MNRLDMDDSLEFALLLAKKLAADLDSGDKSTCELVAKLLVDLPIECSLIALRKNMSIERIVKYDLDTYADFKTIFDAIHNHPGMQGYHPNPTDPEWEEKFINNAMSIVKK